MILTVLTPGTVVTIHSIVSGSPTTYSSIGLGGLKNILGEGTKHTKHSSNKYVVREYCRATYVTLKDNFFGVITGVWENLEIIYPLNYKID